MKGLGAVFVVLVMALAGIGAGYATFYDKVTVHGIAESTDLKVGIRAIGTNDDSSDSDGVPNNPGNVDPYYYGTQVLESDFDVAYTNVGKEVWKFGIEGIGGFYEKMHVKAWKVYENYAPTIEFRVGVKEGSVPATISGIKVNFTEREGGKNGDIVAKGTITISNDGILYYWEVPDGQPPEENTIIYNRTTGMPNLDIISYEIKYGEQQYGYSGNPDANIQNLLRDLGSITIAPGTSADISITARFTDVPPDHYLEGNLTLNYMEFHFSGPR